MFKKISERVPLASLKQYSFGEEVANSVTHGLGVVFAIVSTTVLLTLTCLFGTIYHVICYIVYGFSLILLYTSSTLYHALPFINAKKFFKVCDHVSIYLLIAGTYTPFLILNIKGTLGWILLAVIWSCALMGAVFKFFFTGRFTLASTLLYVAMGWLIMFAAKPLSEAVSPISLVFMITGGLCYTFGAGIYLLKRVPFHHAVWHLFVLSGSVFHFAAILYSMDLNY